MQLTPRYPIQAVCEVLELPRSSFYYAGPEPDEAPLKAAIEEVLEEFPTYGYRRVTKQLQRHAWAVNSKRVRRLLTEMGLQQPRKRSKTRTTNSRHGYPRYPNLVQELTVAHPDQVWVADITYIRLRREFVYLAVLLDQFTRGIRGWHLGRNLDQDLTLTALHRALAERTPQIHHSDHGVQYAATAYVKVLRGKEVQISMAAIGNPRENGFAERVMRTIKEEEVDLSDYEDYPEAYQQIGRFLDEVYMHRRIHSSLGYQTPAEFESRWQDSQTPEERKTETLLTDSRNHVIIGGVD